MYLWGVGCGPLFFQERLSEVRYYPSFLKVFFSHTKNHCGLSLKLLVENDIHVGIVQAVGVHMWHKLVLLRRIH